VLLLLLFLMLLLLLLLLMLSREMGEKECGKLLRTEGSDKPNANHQGFFAKPLSLTQLLLLPHPHPLPCCVDLSAFPIVSLIAIAIDLTSSTS
jgi:hypothetical protein